MAQNLPAEQVSIGGINVALASGDPGMAIGVPPGTERFLVANADADSEVTAVWGDLSEPVSGKLVFDSGLLWKLYRSEDDLVFRFNSPAFGEHAYKEARFNPDFSSGQITLHADYYDRDVPATPLEYPLDELLLTSLLARGRGVEVHACGLRDVDGRGYLFVGHSEAGKTTTARLWEQAGALVLSDDRIILRVLDGTVWMYGTPWHGEAELAVAARSELTRMFILGRGAKNELVPLKLPNAISNLFTRSFVPFYSALALDYTLNLLQQIADAVPCAELRFVPDVSVIDFVRENTK